jgi:hypothetical protein
MPMRRQVCWVDLFLLNLFPSSRWIMWMLLWIWLLGAASAMTPAKLAELREEAVNMFYHGWNSYMKIAFPEDEVGFSPCGLRDP